MPDILCAGCGVGYSHSGHARHLALTANLSCRAYGQSLYGDISNAATVEPPSGSTQHPPAFNGDAFGSDYSAEDFGMAIDDLSSMDPVPAAGGGLTDGQDHPTGAGDNTEAARLGTDSDDEDRDAADDARIFEELNEAHWEPPAAEQLPVEPELEPHQEPEALPSASGPVDRAELNGRHLDPAERRRAEGQLWHSPVVEHFSIGKAGAPLPRDPASSTYDTFRTQVESVESEHPGTNDNNIWAPFASKRDWQIAYWAKTRGPTSSAVTDLLKIDDIIGP
ncbi:hypothetical protein FA95DRAFT_1609561 [Auriscalpium vulgare]|uniref:Uncharacterized protein n=1 Tax=Auriscalpium vulgare TaxID=40419 RepID=A0ACB8RHM1_9AGAM|nr:hypothetical protein FA95DRAFT_1609561 [Auriscalpium vulgare]